MSELTCKVIFQMEFPSLLGSLNLVCVILAGRKGNYFNFKECSLVVLVVTDEGIALCVI